MCVRNIFFIIKEILNFTYELMKNNHKKMGRPSAVILSIKHFGFSYELTLLYCCHLFSHNYAYFLQFIEAMGMFICNKYNRYQCIVFSSNVSISLEEHLFGSVRRSHILF